MTGYRRFFDLVVRVDASFPELAPADPPQPSRVALDVRFRRRPSLSAAGLDHALTPWSESSCDVSQGRFGEAILIRVRALADYWVRPGQGRVDCDPAPGGEPAAARHFLLNQVLPRLVSFSNPLVVHGGAVATERGAVALIGPSGIGKSTLTASFDQSGEAVALADDNALVRILDGCPNLVGGYPCCRLRADSLVALDLVERAERAGPSRAAKRLLCMRGYGNPSAVPLAAICLLEAASGECEAVRLVRLDGMRALLALARNCFLLDGRDRELIGRQLTAVGALLDTGCPVYSLSYPRRYALLPEIRACVLSVLPGASPRLQDAGRTGATGSALTQRGL